jgi:hypothetical protein
MQVFARPKHGIFELGGRIVASGPDGCRQLGTSTEGGPANGPAVDAG